MKAEMNKFCIISGSAAITQHTVIYDDVYLLNRHMFGVVEPVPAHEIDSVRIFKYLVDVGVTHVIALGSCGSLDQSIHPGDFIIPDQYIDVSRRPPQSLFNTGFNHASMGEPFSFELRQKLRENCLNTRYVGATGTYLQISGPTFSTRAESRYYQGIGADIIGMTIPTEAKLAREAGIEYSAICMVTDYDSWKPDRPPVTFDEVQRNAKMMHADAIEMAMRTIRSFK